MLLETSGDFEEFPQQPTMVPIMSRATTAANNLVVFNSLSSHWRQSRVEQGE